MIYHKIDICTKKKELLNLGFNEEQLNKIIIKKFSNNTVTTLINEFHKIIDFLVHDDITAICSKNGGGKTLLKLILRRKALNNLGFTDLDIVAIAANIGGSKTLQAVIDLYPELIKIGFTAQDIVAIAANGGGSKTLQAVIDLRPELIKIGFTAQDIVAIAANGGGSKTLNFIVENKNYFFDEDLNLITKKISRNGGAGIFEKIIQNKNNSHSDADIIFGEPKDLGQNSHL
jgi:chemotaxis response regulator CheB